MFCAKPGRAAIYEPGSNLFRCIAEVEDNLSYSGAAGLTPLLRELGDLGFRHGGRAFHSLIRIMSGQSPYVEHSHN